jgi:uncharacterized protein with HEPN domain
VQREKWKTRVRHIPESIEKIRTYTRKMNSATFCSNSLVVDAVLRNFTIIGEAARNVPPEVTAAHPELPWRSMQDMRNVLVHDYPGVDLIVVWQTIQNDLPPLLPLLRRILEQDPR